MQQNLQKIRGYFAEQIGDVEKVFNPPANEQVIERIQALLPFPLPDDYVRFLGLADGQPIDTEALLTPGQLRFLSLEEAHDLWRELLAYADEAFFDELEDDGRVRAILYHERRFPIAYYELGTQYLMLDFVPGPTGKEGQLVYNQSEASIVAIADDVSDYLHKVVKNLENGTLTVNDLGVESGNRILIQASDEGEEDYEILRKSDG